LRLLTRGLTGSAGAIILTGLGPVAVELVRIIRGGRSQVSRAIKDLGYNFKISAMLIGANGKEFIDPIINVVSKTFQDSDAPSVKVYPKKLIARKSNDIKVEVKNVKVRKNNGRN